MMHLNYIPVGLVGVQLFKAKELLRASRTKLAQFVVAQIMSFFCSSSVTCLNTPKLIDALQSQLPLLG